MPKIWLTEIEQEKLIFNEEFPAWYTKLYLYIKVYMDFETCITGNKRKISYKSMAEYCEYKPNRYSKDSEFIPTKDALRHALKVFEDKELITKLSKGRQENLVLKFNFAFEGQIRLNSQPHHSTIGLPHAQHHQENDLSDCNSNNKYFKNNQQQHAQHHQKITDNTIHHISNKKLLLTTPYDCENPDREKITFSTLILIDPGGKSLPAREIIETLYKKLNKVSDSDHKAFHKTGEPTAGAQMLLARLKNYYPGAIMAVINKYAEKWRGTQQEDYLRPKTLFCKTNLENYVGEVGCLPR